VAKQYTEYIMHYQQTTMFTLFEENATYHKFCIETVNYNKTQTGVSIIIKNIFPLVRNMLPLIENVALDLRSRATYYKLQVKNLQ